MHTVSGHRINLPKDLFHFSPFFLCFKMTHACTDIPPPTAMCRLSQYADKVLNRVGCSVVMLTFSSQVHVVRMTSTHPPRLPPFDPPLLSKRRRQQRS